MADIVQLQENGVKKYLKTHVNAVDGIEEKYVDKTSNETIDGIKTFVKTPLVGTKKVAVVEDTGWVNIAWSENFKDYSGNAINTLLFRRIGNIVHFKGTAAPAKDFTADLSSSVEMSATLSKEWLPSHGNSVNFGKFQGSTSDTWTLELNFGTGRLRLLRYFNTNGVAIALKKDSQWLPFTGTYFV